MICCWLLRSLTHGFDCRVPVIHDATCDHSSEQTPCILFGRTHNFRCWWIWHFDVNIFRFCVFILFQEIQTKTYIFSILLHNSKVGLFIYWNQVLGFFFVLSWIIGRCCDWSYMDVSWLFCFVFRLSSFWTLIIALVSFNIRWLFMVINGNRATYGSLIYLGQ